MVIVIDKDTKPEEVDKALKKIKRASSKKSVSGFFGKLKGAYGDGLTYQKKLRDEWD